MKKAFTLVEILAVVAVISLTAGLAAYTLNRTARPGDDARAWVDRLIRLDGWGRAAARHSGLPVELMVRRDGVVFASEGQKRREEVPPGVRIDEVRFLPSGSPADRQMSILPTGRSPNYALRIRSKSGSIWLVVFGATGQVIVEKNDADARDILATISRTRLDTD